MKSYPKSGQVDDLDALLGAPIQLKNEGAAGKQEEKNISPSAEDGKAKTDVKREDEDQPSRSNVVDDRVVDKPKHLKMGPEADGVAPSGIIFKKRKPKPTKDNITVDSK